MTELEPAATPNPDALRFTLPFRLRASFNVRNSEEAEAEPFTAALFAAGGVASVFGVNDFVTITRIPGAEWAPIVAAVQAASGLLKPAAADECTDDVPLETARELLRAAMASTQASHASEPAQSIDLSIGGVRRRPRPTSE